ncbi:uncharacterized protein Dana_GF11855 [Drosophila ananassae]|uniref:Little elongation complex subunit 1 n=1 Tax=Drosophila ananassae TaxID=7217 RepID=B3MF03_DROAN|nr:little elongation complex subunit 1 [Drosophila ananassae]EDV36624.1 uncharacterized protein Dana_GF11855 [Drosophila ananassae]
MDFPEFSDINIDQLLSEPAPLGNGVISSYKQIPTPRINGNAKGKRSLLAERIAQSDDLIRQLKQLQTKNKQLTDLQKTAKEVTELYQKEKQLRLELEERSNKLAAQCGELEKQLDVQVATCENLQDELQEKGLPVEAKDVLGILMQFYQRLGDDCGLGRRENNIMKKLKDYCKTAEIPVPPPRSPTARHKRKSPQNGVNQSTQTDQEPAKEKPLVCSVGVQVGKLVETRSQGSQYKRTTTTRGTTTACFIEKRDVGTCFPEPVLSPKVRQILDEMLSWRTDKVISPLSPLSPISEVQEICSAVSVATCTTLCNIQREIDYMPEVPSQIKVSASRPPSRAMMDGIKEEARYSLGNKELAKELLNFLPQNQSCLANLSPQAFDELWQVFGQMVLGLLQRRSIQQSASNADFVSWLHELYESTESYPAEVCTNTTNKKDFSAGTDCVDIGTDPIVLSPNISYGGNVTPIRIPPKPKERKSKQKKRKATSSVKSSPKRKCLEADVLEDKNNANNKPVDKEDQNEKVPETAIQFLSNLNTFNMANCDNLNMELDEEEMYLLQLTTNSKSQGPEQISRDEVQLEVTTSTTNLLPAVQNESNSLRDDEGIRPSEEVLPKINEPLPFEPEPENEPEEAKNTEIFEEKASKPTTEGEPALEELLSVGSSLEEEKSRVAKKLQTLKSLFGSDSDSDGLIKWRDEQLSQPGSKPCEESSTDAEILSLLTVRPSNALIADFDSISSEELPKSEEAGEDQADDDPRKTPPERLEESLCLSDFTSDSPELVDLSLSLSDCSSDSPKHMVVSSCSGDSKSDVPESLDVPTCPADSKLEAHESLEESLFLSDSSTDSEAENVSSNNDESKGERGTMDMDDIQLDKYLSSELPSSAPRTTSVEKNSGHNVKAPEVESSALPVLRSTTKNVYGSSDDSDNPRLVIDESAESMSDWEKTPSPLSDSPKLKRNIKSVSSLLEVRMTRSRAKQLEQKLDADGRTSLVDQIRKRLKHSLPSDLEGRPLASDVLPKVVEAHVAEGQPSNVNTTPEELPRKKDKSCPEPSRVIISPPASPPPEPIEEHDEPIDIPLEQDMCQRIKGPPLLISHVIYVSKNQEQRKLPEESEKRKLNETLDRYLKDTMYLNSTLRDLEDNIKKVTNNEVEIVDAMITVICKIGFEANPMIRLMNALQYFDFTERFMLRVELRLFRFVKDRPQTAMAMTYVRLYLKMASMMGHVENPARLLLAKILYHYDKDMPVLVLELLTQFPTVIPHREQREYDHSDPLITVIKHLLMNKKYDMTDPESPERLLLSKLRFEFHFKTFEPTANQVLENLVEKLKAGRLEQLGYAFALFCRRSPYLKIEDTVLGEHLMPLAASYCDLATRSEDYDDRLQSLVQCMSMALKPLPIDTDIAACVGLFKRLLVAVPRPAVQQAVVQAILRLQRFGFMHVSDVLQNYRPEYSLEPLTRAMLRSFAERRRKYVYSQTHRKFQRD